MTVREVSRVSDTILIAATWLGAFWLRFHAPLIPVTRGFPAFSTYAAWTPLIVVLWATIFNGQGVYGARRWSRRRSETARVMRAHGTALLCFIALTYVFSEYQHSRAVLAYFGVVGAAALYLSRLLLAALFRALRRGGFRIQNVLLIGDGDSLERLIGRIRGFPDQGLRVVGVLIPDGVTAVQVAGKRVLGRFSDASRAIRQTEAHRVLIALGRQQWAELEQILRDIQDETVDLQVLPDLHEYAALGCGIEDLDGLPIVSLNERPLYGVRAAGRRVTDALRAASLGLWKGFMNRGAL